MPSILDLISKTADFSGRASRAECAHLLVLNASVSAGFIAALWEVGAEPILMASSSVLARRLHDVGLRGIWVLWLLAVPQILLTVTTPLVAGLVMFGAIESEADGYPSIPWFAGITAGSAVLAWAVFGALWVLYQISQPGEQGENAFGPALEEPQPHNYYVPRAIP